jgi:hypothetical protein
LISAKKREMPEWPEDHGQTLTARNSQVVVMRVVVIMKVEAEVVAVVDSTTVEAVAGAAEDVAEAGGET